MGAPHRAVFPTYELREDAFRRTVAGLIPRRYGGPRMFWEDFKAATREGVERALERPVAYITADPRDCLAFGSPRQVLAAALMTASGGPPAAGDLRRLASDYRIAGNLDQPVRTLSGGETVKVALAKADALRPAVSRLVIASPFSWLSRDNHPLLDRLVERCDRQGLPVEVLLLADEDDDRPAAAGPPPPGPHLHLRLAGVSTALSPAVGVVGEVAPRAAVADGDIRLASPCLVTGANGEGKSLVARLLAGAVTHRGRIEIAADGQAGRARLLFQDVMTQTLLRSRVGIARSAGVREGAVRDAAADLERWIAAFRPAAAAAGGPAPTLAAVKSLLTAVRLAARPALLILDEPDWGLSRDDAVAFVRGVTEAAHDGGTAVMIISHKPWWPPLAASAMRVARAPAGGAALDGAAFRVRLVGDR